MSDMSDMVLLAGVALVAWGAGFLGFAIGVLMGVIGKWEREREDEAQRCGDAGPTVDARGRRV